MIQKNFVNRDQIKFTKESKSLEGGSWNKRTSNWYNIKVNNDKYGRIFQEEVELKTDDRIVVYNEC